MSAASLIPEPRQYERVGTAGSTLRTIRRALGLTQAEAGKIVGLSASQLGRIERDDLDDTLRPAMRAATAYGTWLGERANAH